MSGRDILQLFPSRANLVLMKQRIAAATTGLSLLKRKRDALELHLRQIVHELKIFRSQIDDVMQEAIFSMVKAKFLCTDFRPATVEQPDAADAFLQVKQNKIVGMNVPSFELILRSVTSLPLTGLSSGGQQVEIVRQKFQDALRILMSIASLEYNHRVVADAVKLNNRRVNGLEFVVLPRYQRTLNYIRDELDEFEREDFYRLKRSQAKQNKKKAEFKARMEKRSPLQGEQPQIQMDISDWTSKTAGAGQMGSKGAASEGVRRRTISNLQGNKVILVPEDKVKPVIIGSQIKPRPEKKADKSTKDIVTTSSSSSLSS